MKGTKRTFIVSLLCLLDTVTESADSTNPLLKITPIDQYLAGMLKKTKMVRVLNYLCRLGSAAVKVL